MKKPEGVLTALITPFGQNGKMAVSKFHLERNIEFQIQAGVFGIVPAGTTGETPTFEWHEQMRFIRELTTYVRKRLFVLAGTGSNSTAEAQHHSRLAVGHYGADGALVVDCYYNKPASDQLLRYYHIPVALEVFEANPEAIYVPYIIPGRTCCQLEPGDLALLAKQCSNVVGVKEATGNLENMALTRQLLGSDFAIMSGDDGLTAQMMLSNAVRGNGVISVMSNIVPKAIVDMVAAFARNDVIRGQELNVQLKPLFDLVMIKAKIATQVGDSTVEREVKYPNPCSIKTMMAILGMDSGLMRPPLGPMAPSGVAIVRQALRQVWNNNPELLAPIEAHYKVDIAARLVDDKILESLAI